MDSNDIENFRPRNSHRGDGLSFARYWTPQALECLLLKHNCEQCSVPEFFKSQCKMKVTVQILIKKKVKVPESLREKKQEIIKDNYTKDYYEKRRELKVNKRKQEQQNSSESSSSESKYVIDKPVENSNNIIDDSDLEFLVDDSIGSKYIIDD